MFFLPETVEHPIVDTVPAQGGETLPEETKAEKMLLQSEICHIMMLWQVQAVEDPQATGVLNPIYVPLEQVYILQPIRIHMSAKPEHQWLAPVLVVR